jgi:hypothetical protein
MLTRHEGRIENTKGKYPTTSGGTASPKSPNFTNVPSCTRIPSCTRRREKLPAARAYVILFT